MGYTVHYCSTEKDKVKKTSVYRALSIGIFSFFLSLFLASKVWPAESERVRAALFPWERQPVRQAFQELQRNLKEGDAVGDAITAFCLDILESP